MDSFISWIGGKKLLRNIICSHFPSEEPAKYVEVFGGAGWVLFNKDKHAKFEVYNDVNSNLTNLFKCVKYHPKAIEEELDMTLYSREVFLEYKEIYKYDGLTDIQRATKFLYLIKTSFGSKVTTFGAKARNITNTEYLREAHKRLAKVIIENKSFEKLIQQYDRVDTLFYCDPPYYGTESYYNHSDDPFTKQKHVELANILKSIKGKVILSYNDCKEIRELYKDFIIIEVERNNNLSNHTGNAKSPYKELIIKNFNS